jgi:hypothetical protein
MIHPMTTTIPTQKKKRNILHRCVGVERDYVHRVERVWVSNFVTFRMAEKTIVTMTTTMMMTTIAMMMTIAMRR